MALLAFLSAGPWAGGGEPAFELSFAAPERFDGRMGERVRFAATCLLKTSGIEAGRPGARAWSFGVACEGGRIVAATTAGTVAALFPAGLQKGGFELAAVTGGAGNVGAVSACV
jgi:hypothetical protein